MAISAENINAIIELVKKYFHEAIKPDMTIEKIAEVASPNLDKIIQKNEKMGLKYSAGKFKIEYLNEKQFTLEFEMYFKDESGKWYKAANKSEPRDAELIEKTSWKTLQKLKVVEFPIGAPVDEKIANDEKITNEKKSVDEKISDEKVQSEIKSLPQESTTEIKSNTEIKSDKNKTEITLDKLMNAKK